MRRSLLILSLVFTASSFALGQVGGKSGAGAPDDAKSLLKLTDDLTAAKAGLDIRFLESVLDDEFVLTNPAGAFANKTEYIEGARSDVAVKRKEGWQCIAIHLTRISGQ